MDDSYETCLGEIKEFLQEKKHKKGISIIPSEVHFNYNYNIDNIDNIAMKYISKGNNPDIHLKTFDKECQKTKIDISQETLGLRKRAISSQKENNLNGQNTSRGNGKCDKIADNEEQNKEIITSNDEKKQFPHRARVRNESYQNCVNDFKEDILFKTKQLFNLQKKNKLYVICT